jgi:retron-type reverse transcriptase
MVVVLDEGGDLAFEIAGQEVVLKQDAILERPIYGFRPGRSAHQALRTLHDAIISERVNWVFEADIRKFYDSINHS